VGQMPPESGVLHHVDEPAPPTQSDMPTVSGFETSSVGLSAVKSVSELRAG